jgi:hypothetical protein
MEPGRTFLAREVDSASRRELAGFVHAGDALANPGLQEKVCYFLAVNGMDQGAEGAKSEGGRPDINLSK